jgi:peptide/nickel transport system permease protein
VNYIVRRVISGLVIVFALTWITFALFWLLPAEPWRAIVTNPAPTKAEIAAANHKLGVDRPVYVQYGKFVWGIVRHGSFGRDYYQNQPVTTFLKQALPVTWSIVFGGVILLVVLALPLAIVSALWANTALDRIILTVTIVGVALHPFIIGIGLRGLFANRLGWLPAYYYCPLRGKTELSTLDPGSFTYNYTSCGGVGGWASHLALPWLTFAVIFLPLYVRMLRGSLIEVMDSPYILTAHAKGAGLARVLRVHVLRNAMLQPLTMIGMEIGLALTVAVYL